MEFCGNDFKLLTIYRKMVNFYCNINEMIDNICMLNKIVHTFHTFAVTHGIGQVYFFRKS